MAKSGSGQRRSVAELAAGAVVLVVAVAFIAYAASNTGRGPGGGLKLTARFENIGSLTPGADVRLGGVKVGSVVATSIDVKTYQAIVTFSVQPDLALPTDSSATISSGGLLGGSFLGVSPGGADAVLRDGQAITITQSASNLEDLLGKFIFNVGNLADATQKSLQQKPGVANP